MTQRTFNNVRFTSRHKTNISSLSIIFCQMSILTGIKPVICDCCPNSCIAYTQKYIHHSSCPICNERHFQANGQPRSQFTYFPLIPHLQGFFQSNQTVARMSYRRDFRVSIPVLSCILPYHITTITNCTVYPLRNIVVDDARPHDPTPSALPYCGDC